MTTPARPAALLSAIGWFWLVNAGTLLLLLLGLLAGYPLYREWLAGWVALPPLPGMEPLAWLGARLLPLLLVHVLLCLFALAAGLALLKQRRWAAFSLEGLSWASLAYTLLAVWVYFHFWFSLLAAVGPTDLALSPTVFHALIIGIGLGLGLMIGLPFAIVARLLHRPDLRAATR
ncbi:MAG: hypothetical protein LPK58_01300 [Gammaproteobacteria bacterium]|nr:hypothetical protein [Gammaproteobacteria bacterium]